MSLEEGGGCMCRARWLTERCCRVEGAPAKAALPVQVRRALQPTCLSSHGQPRCARVTAAHVRAHHHTHSRVCSRAGWRCCSRGWTSIGVGQSEGKAGLHCRYKPPLPRPRLQRGCEAAGSCSAGVGAGQLVGAHVRVHTTPAAAVPAAPEGWGQHGGALRVQCTSASEL